MTVTSDYLARLDAVEMRLAAAAAAEPLPDALTDADPRSGERWERGQAWGHLAEFMPYWIAEAGPVLRGQESGEPVPFGRTHVDAGRLSAIERGRQEPMTALWAETQAGITALRDFLGRMGPDQWEVVGFHVSRGPMTVNALVEEFLVGHLEQHADQLEGMAEASS